ncbi:kelch-like protein 2 [Montipora foliosa]|uniref:kelch-like protein 2 n=1 Tax=Montipora foliosa TaxID=591990 RepID=UPI0035F208DA
MEEKLKLTSGCSENGIENAVFTPQDTSDCGPCDVTLVVNNGRTIKAHRDVLVGASTFFEKLLGTDMRESREGVIHLKMLTETTVGIILEFMYTGSVQMIGEDPAKVMIEIADYLLLKDLKSHAESYLEKKLDCSNSLSLFHLAEKYNCKELFCRSKTFIFDHFKKIAGTEDFLNNTSNDEVEMWISSDDINVDAEEDVFEIILKWINHDKVRRSNFFAALFRHIRLAYISYDYLMNNMETNDFLKSNQVCLKLLRTSLKSKSKAKDHMWQKAVKPRRSLEVPVMLFFERGERANNLCYFPRENAWYKAPSVVPTLLDKVFSSQDKLYLTAEWFEGGDYKLFCFDPFSNRLNGLSTLCTSLSLSKGPDSSCRIFVTGGNEIYALVGQLRGTNEKTHLTCITKYNPESDSWEDVSAFDWDSRTGVCIVNKDNFIYFLGGRLGCNMACLSEAHRFDLGVKRWERLADMNVERFKALGAVAYGKVFVIGGGGMFPENCYHLEADLRRCELYDEAKDEWYMTASLNIPRRIVHSRVAGLMCTNDKLYALCEYSVNCKACPSILSLNYGTYCSNPTSIMIDCYDPEKDQWIKKTEIPGSCMLSVDQACSISVFNRSAFIKTVSSTKINTAADSGSYNQERLSDIRRKQNCLVM